MIRRLATAVLALVSVVAPALAQEAVTEARGALLRGLDRVSGEAMDLRLAKGETGELGWLQITLGECRYPTDNPSGDAFAWLVIHERDAETPIFEGWMIASSPALNALDHSRFDVWVIRCTTSEGDGSGSE